MLEFVSNALTSGHQQGFARTRVWANMEWALTGAPGVEALADYESQLNCFLPQSDDAVVCAYDVERFPAAILEMWLEPICICLQMVGGVRIRITFHPKIDRTCPLLAPLRHVPPLPTYTSKAEM